MRSRTISILILSAALGSTILGCADSSSTAVLAATTTPSEDASSWTTTGEPTGSGDPSSTSHAAEENSGSSTTERPGLAPVIVSVEAPDKVSGAGPVVFTMTTENTMSARARLDGVDLGGLVEEGAGVFSGVAAIRGAVDNGVHVLEVVAESDGQVDERAVAFLVDAPPPGTLAWEVAGPVGSRPRRLALTESGDILELGTQNVDGVPLPMLRKRSAINGAQLWARQLDHREGTAEDILVAPDGDLWVAMNVRINAASWRPRIVRLDADGTFAGVEVPAEAGQTVRALAGDHSGGCLAAGFAGTDAGDSDVVVWSITASNALKFVRTWDYHPGGEKPPQPFVDIANAVVVMDGVGWIVGGSSGPHDGGPLGVRGLVVRMDVATGEVLGQTVGSASAQWPQSVFLGAAPHPLGVLVTGTACDAACTTQRVETALFTASGNRLWWRPETSASAAVGHALALGREDRVYVAATVHDGTALRGQLLARDVYEVVVQPFTLGLSTSETTDVAVDPFGRIYAVGWSTNGQTQDGRTFHVHP